MNSLLLTLPGANPTTSPGWDLSLDDLGNIAVATGDYAIAQDVACICRAFKGEVWYNINEGIPYFQQILGYNPSIQFMKSQYIALAETVPGVVSAKCFLTGPGFDRSVGGQIQLTGDSGTPIGTLTTTNLPGQLPWYINVGSGAEIIA